MTASASVVDLKPCPFCGSDSVSDRRCEHARDPSGDFDMVGCTKCGAGIIDGTPSDWNRRTTPQPAEQDAREAVASEIRRHVHGNVIDLGGRLLPGLGISGVHKAADAILALTQAAPDGCAETVDHDRIVADLADELIYGGGLVNRGVDRGLVVVERSDKSDPHYRLCSALEARRAASPAPPAQGAGG